MTDSRTLSRRLKRIEADESDQSPEEWTDEYAQNQASNAGSVPIEGSDESAGDVLVTSWENDHYSIEFRASEAEIPDRFDAADFPV